MSLRRRIIDGPACFAIASGLLSGWMRLVAATSRVDRQGWDEFAETIDSGEAVIICCWHQRIMVAPLLMPGREGRCTSLTSHKRPGRIMGQMQKRLGFNTLPMPPGTLGTREMRAILGALRKGNSICLSPDGSSGPAFVLKSFPIQWARASGAPIFFFSYSCKRFWTLPTWDRMVVPLPFNRISLRWQRWDRDVPRQCEDIEALRVDLQECMNRQLAEVDTVYGCTP